MENGPHPTLRSRRKADSRGTWKEAGGSTLVPNLDSFDDFRERMRQGSATFDNLLTGVFRRPRVPDWLTPTTRLRTIAHPPLFFLFFRETHRDDLQMIRPSTNTALKTKENRSVIQST
ncbi:hypothetical protein MTO96_006968 [Rhipicephalus appendiculatus]